MSVNAGTPNLIASIADNDILVTKAWAPFSSSFISVFHHLLPGRGLFLILIGLSVYCNKVLPVSVIHSSCVILFCLNVTVGDEGHNKI